MMSALPPRSGESPSRRAGGVSRLAMMQARFQAKQLEEKEEKLIHMLEEKQAPLQQDEMIQRVNHGRDSVNSVNSLSSTASSNSMNGSTGQRPGINGKQNGGGGKVRQMFEQRRNGGKVSPVGWDKSYPLEPVEAINSDIGGMTRSGMYKQNVTRQNSNTSSKYGGNYGPKTPAPNQGDKRGLSLDRVNRGRTSQGSFGYGQSTSMVRAQSQANIQGYGYQNTPTHQRVRKASGGSVSGRYSNYDVSPDESPPMQRRSNYGQVPSQERDYTRPMPPTYRRQGRQTGTGSRVGDPSPSRQSYRDSAYSSHSSHSSDNPNFPVIATNPRGAPPLSTQSSPSKTFSRQNSFTSESNTRTINSRTFRKQKSPLRNRSPSVSPSRSVENSDETDPEINNEYENRVASRTAEREREEERRRMQVEMRKREQELLARIKEQQKELDSVKAEKSKVEKQLTRQEREMEEERRKMFDRERILEEEKHQRQLEEKERKIQGERDEKIREEQDQVDSHEPRRRDQDLRSKPHDRVLMRDKASPAHLRGKRPPSLVSMEDDDENWLNDSVSLPLQHNSPLSSPPTKRAQNRDLFSTPKSPSTVKNSFNEQLNSHYNKKQNVPESSSLFRRPSIRRQESVGMEQSKAKNNTLERRPSIRRKESLGTDPSKDKINTLERRHSIRNKEIKPPDYPTVSLDRKPSLRRKTSTQNQSREPDNKNLHRTPSVRRKLSHNVGLSKNDSLTQSMDEKRSGFSLSRIRVPSRGPSREPSFDNEDDRDSVSSGGRSNKISNHNNSVNIEIKNTSKKNVPPSPSPAVKKKVPPRRSVFAPKPRDDLNSCKHCGRNFAEDRIEKHEEICLKTTQKKRKVFDMTKTRTKGTDAAKYVKSAAQMKAQEAKDEKKSNWRKKREEFVATLRAAKEAQKHLANGGSLKDLPPPPPMDTSDYIQCPHCSRRFAEAAADRHIPKCKDIKSNKKN